MGSEGQAKGSESQSRGLGASHKGFDGQMYSLRASQKSLERERSMGFVGQL